MSDTELWIDFISGKDEAFRIIYEKYFDDLFKYGCYFLDDEDLVKDCIQDLFVNLHSYRSKLKPTDKIRPYLIVSLRQCIFKKLRSISEEKSKLVSIDNLSFGYSFVEETDEDQDEKLALLQKALNELTPRQREAIYLRYVTGLSYEELSVSMGLSYQASRNLICHSMERLRKAVAQESVILLLAVCLTPFLKKELKKAFQ